MPRLDRETIGHEGAEGIRGFHEPSLVGSPHRRQRSGLGDAAYPGGGGSVAAALGQGEGRCRPEAPRGQGVDLRHLRIPGEARSVRLAQARLDEHEQTHRRPHIEQTSTSQGRPHSIFKRALQRRNVVGALAAARELPQLSLIDALDLTLLVARKDPRRRPRVPTAGLNDACSSRNVASDRRRARRSFSASARGR